MPINRKWPIEAVVDAVRGVRLRTRERITFEYVLLGGVTDQPEHAAEVARLVRRTGLPAKVNLIAWNPGPGIEYHDAAGRRLWRRFGARWRLRECRCICGGRGGGIFMRLAGS